jgi:DNA modification methylase
MSYEAFVAGKLVHMVPTGIADAVCKSKLSFPFQNDLVSFALRRGRAAIFADTGLGKSRMQAEWAWRVAKHTGKPVLIFAPLAVATQTRDEALRVLISITVVKDGSEVTPNEPGVYITNYDRLHLFDMSVFGGVVLDESSIIKHYQAKTFQALCIACADTAFKLCCTATPSPNDYTELGTHAEFLGICTRAEMLAEFFCHDGGETQVWRLKGHARQVFWKFVASWAALVRSPADLGYDASAYVLPELSVEHHVIEADPESVRESGLLFAMPAKSLMERRAARKGSLGARVEQCAAMVNASAERWIVWTDLNAESTALTKSINGAVEVTGSMSTEEKESAIAQFVSGEARVLVSKSSICGFGMNFQFCAHMAFVGVTDSYEAFYQAVRRIWRFGQLRECIVHIFASELEGAVIENLKRKERDAKAMAEELSREASEAVRSAVRGSTRETNEYAPRVRMRSPIKGGNKVSILDQELADRFAVYQGDCVEVLKGLPDKSVGYSVFSPPFSSLYTYSNSPRDMGNSRSYEEFFAHFGFLVDELLRVLKPGRLVSAHCMQLPTSKERDGYIGLRNFRDDLIRSFQAKGFIYHSEVCIWKDPVTAMQRTKAIGLLHKQIKKDSSISRQGIADYVVTMRKPDPNEEPIAHTADEFPVSLWQRYASPVWMDINPSDTLQYRSAREHDDERHIAPLQLEVIRRCIQLWSNPKDTVLSPFAGIGSEGHVALEQGRRFIGAELKRSYYEQAVKNLHQAASAGQQTMSFAEGAE